MPGVLAFACAIILGCSSDIQEARARPYIPPLAITISPASLSLAPGANAVFTADPSGGEAIRLIVDWAIQEGPAGGSLTMLSDNKNANLSVRYTAPASGGGPYHLVASIHGFPAVKATATINGATGS